MKDHRQEDEINIFELYHVLLRKWKPLFVSTCFGIILGFIVSSQIKETTSYSYTLHSPKIDSQLYEKLILEQINASQINASQINASQITKNSSEKLIQDFVKFIQLQELTIVKLNTRPKRGQYIPTLSGTNQLVVKEALSSILEKYRKEKELQYNKVITRRINMLKKLSPYIQNTNNEEISISNKINILKNITVDFQGYTPYTTSNEPIENVRKNNQKAFIVGGAILGLLFSTFVILIYNSYTEWKINKT